MLRRGRLSAMGKRVIARQLDALMQHQGLTKSALAKKMRTSRTQLDRLLDPENGCCHCEERAARRSNLRHTRAGASDARLLRGACHRAGQRPDPLACNDGGRAWRVSL